MNIFAYIKIHTNNIITHTKKKKKQRTYYTHTYNIN